MQEGTFGCIYGSSNVPALLVRMRTPLANAAAHVSSAIKREGAEREREGEGKWASRYVCFYLETRWENHHAAAFPQKPTGEVEGTHGTVSEQRLKLNYVLCCPPVVL